MSLSQVELEGYLVKFRHNLHKEPELSNEEFKTTKKIKEALQAQDIKVLNLPLKTGVVAEPVNVTRLVILPSFWAH